MNEYTKFRFVDRADAGRRLAAELSGRELRRPVVLALPRGGVPVGREIADALDAPLEAIISRKIGLPAHPEYGIGAVAEGSGRVVLSEHAAGFRLSGRELARLGNRELREVERRVDRYRDGRPLPSLRGRSAVLVDDGLATGVTAEAALAEIHRMEPHEVVLAVPVCSPTSTDRLRRWADIVCLVQPPAFRAVGSWYEDFRQVSDDEVLDLLRRASVKG